MGRLFGERMTTAGFRQLTQGQMSDAMVDLSSEVDEKQVTIDIDRVANQLAKIAFLPWHKSIADKEVFRGQIRCLELLGRYLNMFGEKKDAQTTKDLAKELRDAYIRVSKLDEKTAKLAGN